MAVNKKIIQDQVIKSSTYGSNHSIAAFQLPNGTDNKVCEIRLAVPGNDLFAKKHSDSFEDAVTKVIDALREQIEKMKITQAFQRTAYYLYETLMM